MLSLWNIWNTSLSAFECLLLSYVLTNHLPLRNARFWPYFAGLAGLCAARTAMSVLRFSYALSLGADGILCLVFCCMLFGGSTALRILWVFIWTACRALTLAAAAVLLSALPDINLAVAAPPTPEAMGIQIFCLAALALLCWGLVRIPAGIPRKWAGKVHIAALGAMALGILGCAQIASSGFLSQVGAQTWQSLRTIAMCTAGMMVFCAVILDAGGQMAWTKDAARERALASERELDSVRYAGELARTWKHDFGQMLSVMRALAAQGDLAALEEYLGSVQDVYAEDLLGASTGDAALDAVLRTKVVEARNEGIAVSCTIGQIGGWCRCSAELSIILSNLLNNAIEGCRSIAPEKRFLMLHIATSPDGLVIRIANSSSGKYAKGVSGLLSTKVSGDHGYGFRRVERQIRRIGGALRLHPSADRFEASVYFPPFAKESMQVHAEKEQAGNTEGA